MPENPTIYSVDFRKLAGLEPRVESLCVELPSGRTLYFEFLGSVVLGRFVHTEKRTFFPGEHATIVQLKAPDLHSQEDDPALIGLAFEGYDDVVWASASQVKKAYHATQMRPAESGSKQYEHPMPKYPKPF